MDITLKKYYEELEKEAEQITFIREENIMLKKCIDAILSERNETLYQLLQCVSLKQAHKNIKNLIDSNVSISENFKKITLTTEKTSIEYTYEENDEDGSRWIYRYTLK